VSRQVSLACIVDEQHPIESCVGDWVLIHVGFAMSRIDEAEARKTLELFAALGDIEGDLQDQLTGQRP
jgi:hydrogenase expression/formation protein HypC